MEVITESAVSMDCDECGKHTDRLLQFGNDIEKSYEPVYWICLDCLKVALILMESDQ